MNQEHTQSNIRRKSRRLKSQAWSATFLGVFLALVTSPGVLRGEETVADPDADVISSAPEPDEATLFPIPNYSGDLFTREALAGDWGGVRTSLADHGIQLEVGVSQFYQGLVSGGTPDAPSAWQYSGVADYHLKLDTGKAGLWPGGFLDIHSQTFFGNPSTDGGALIPTNIGFALSAPYGAGTYLPHITMVQFLNEKFAVVLGKINTAVGDPNAFTPNGLGLDSFMNMSFAFNLVTVHVSPYSTLAGGFLYMPNEDVTIGFTAFDSDGTMVDAGFDTVFNGNTTYTGQVQVKTDFFDRPGTQRLLFMYSTKTYTTLDQDPRFLLPAQEVVEPETSDSSWNASWNFDQYVTDNWGVFGRIGVSDGEVNLIKTFYSAGIGGKGIIPGRENDRFGVGWFYAKLSESFVGSVLKDSEQGIEIFYNIAVTPWFALTADAQFIDAANKQADNATVLGLRGRVTF